MDSSTVKRRREGFCHLCDDVKRQHQHQQKTAAMTTAITTTITAAPSSSLSSLSLLSSSPDCIGSNLHNMKGVMLTVFGYLDTRSLFRVSLVRKDWNWTKMNNEDNNNICVNQLWTILANSMIKVPTTTEFGTRRGKGSIMYERPTRDKQYIKDQLKLKKRLNHGLLHSIDKECWCQIWFRLGCNPSSKHPHWENEGMLARITAINGEYYAFSSVCVTGDRGRPEIVLVHSDQFAVEWVNNGHNAAGRRICGTVLEHDFRRCNTAFWTGARYDDDDGYDDSDYDSVDSDDSDDDDDNDDDNDDDDDSDDE
jgi:hypothetical protein